VSVRINGLNVPVTAIIPAAGSGRRMGSATVKQFLPLSGEPVLRHTLGLFSQSDLIDEIVVVASDLLATEAAAEAFTKVSRIVQGGASRQESVWAGLQVVHSRPRVICVHDAARPLLPPSVLESVLQDAAHYPAQVVAVPVKDTIKMATPDGWVTLTPDRAQLWAVQTPQVFWVEPMLQAFRQALADGYVGTDCASLLERAGVRVHIHPGSAENIKLTTPEDFAVAAAILDRRNGRAAK
jgi:2-C-methyl-D-erythritol 4-phosphate cytidylyltransferase